MSSWRAACHARHLADSNEVLSCVRCRHIPKEKLRTQARSSRRETALLQLFSSAARVAHKGAARALDNDQDRDHGIPISLCCLVRVVVVTGSTFDILGFFSSPRVASLATPLLWESRCAELRGELWRPNDQLLSLKPADLFWQAGYGGHDGRLTDVVRPSVPSADAFESSSGREDVCVSCPFNN
jgi:hypothetical protein